MTAASLATAGAVIDAVGRMQTWEQLLPAHWTRYLPIGYLSGFILALWLVKEDKSDAGLLPSQELAFDQLRNENKALRQRLDATEPRRLNSEQIQIVLNHLKPFFEESRKRDPNHQPVLHLQQGAGTDCGDLFNQFHDVFEKAGFLIWLHKPPQHRGDERHFRYGIWIHWDSKWRDKYELPHDGPVIAEALVAAGIEDVTLVERESSFTGVVIGSRRPS